MPLTIRPATLDDVDAIAGLMLADAQVRQAENPSLWVLAPQAEARCAASLRAAMAAEAPPFRQQWLLAEEGGRALGVTHAILLPVPPIYAGEQGAPGLVMEDCAVSPDAPDGTREALLAAAEDDLLAAGARILLASSLHGGEWEPVHAARGYAPLTAYFAKTGLCTAPAFPALRPAVEGDVPAIVSQSAVHRQALHRIHPLFWKPHPQADERFGAWMRRSLTLADRDMVVVGDPARGYAISQPATALHFPVTHDITGIGVIDDFFHAALGDVGKLGEGAEEAAALFTAAEAARAARGDHSLLVVCPAHWPSKIALLESLGYRNAITWHIRVPG